MSEIWNEKRNQLKRNLKNNQLTFVFILTNVFSNHGVDVDGGGGGGVEVGGGVDVDGVGGVE